jgi:hypothetical protein
MFKRLFMVVTFAKEASRAPARKHVAAAARTIEVTQGSFQTPRSLRILSGKSEPGVYMRGFLVSVAPLADFCHARYR